MKSLPAMLVTVSFMLCSCATRPPALMHRAADDAANTQHRVLINTPVSMSGQVDEKKGKIGVTKVSFSGDVGWAIDYHLMFIARSIDKGKTWRVVTESAMPWGLHVVSADCAWVWDLYTTETDWRGVPNSVHVTQDGGKTWHGIPPLVDWLYNVEVQSASQAVVIGRIRPENWPEPTAESGRPDPRKLPLVRFETKDGGSTFTRL
jgi:starvation-inducible outer membrane lipoprotein